MQVRGEQSHGWPACVREQARVAGLHSLGVGVPAWLRQSGAMPPSSRQHSLRKVRPGAPGSLALASTAAYNKAVNTDAQRVRAAARPTLSGRRLLLRYRA
jgi:hypothetical protein